MAKDTDKPAPAAKDTKPAAAPVETKPAPAVDPNADEISQLKEQLARTQAELDATKKAADSGGFSADDLKLVAAKCEAGLDRAQAEEVVRAQRAHDAALAKG